MDKKKVFDILGMEATNDSRLIKMAYREKLVQVNPEDDPEGFKNLREAYEEALRLVKIQEEEGVEEEDDLPDTPVNRWLKRVKSIYSSLSSRIDAQNWKNLFEDEICRDFDTFIEARDAFLGFLMDNFRLTEEVWQLIQDTFNIVEAKEELYEKFPMNFVDFITKEAESKGWMDFKLFEGDDEADVDGYIRQFLALRGMNDNKKYDGVKEVFEGLEQIELWHPYVEAEKIRYFMTNDMLEDAREIVDKLRMKKVEDLYARYYIAEFLMESGDLEGAYEECNGILQVNPEYHGAMVLLSDYYLKKGDYNEAKERYIKLLEIDNYNEYLREGLQKANVALIESLKEKIDNEPNNKEAILELAWCFYQNKMHEECLALTDNLKVDDEIYYDYYNLLGRTYIELEDYEKGFPCVEKWLEEILKTVDDGTEKMRKRLDRLGLAYFLMSRCYFYFGMEKGNKKENLDKCLEYLDLAVKNENNTGSILQYLSAKAQVYLRMEENKRCVDVCEEIIRMEREYYPAYLLRQEAYFNLKMSQEVIDDYYNAINIYAGNAFPYILAAKVYLLFNQCEDAKAVLKRAKEEGVESKELKFLELKNERLTAKNVEEMKKVIIKLEKLFEGSKDEPMDLAEPADIIHEQALCYYDIRNYEAALKVIDRKLCNKKSLESILLKGDILKELKRFDDAISFYKETLKEEPQCAEIYYRMGLCYNAIDNGKYALDCFLKAAEYDAEHPYANNELMEFYKKRYQENYKQEDYKTAVEYAKRQVEINPHCYYITDLGLMYLEGYDMKEAIRAFERAIEKDESSPYPYNNLGYTHKILGKFDKAYEYYQLAIEHLDSEEVFPYWNLVVYYRSTRQFEKAIETLNMLSSNNKGDSLFANKKILEVYIQSKSWDKALEQAKKVMELQEQGLMEYLLDCGDIYAFSGDIAKAMPYYKDAVKKFPRRTMPYIKFGNYLLWLSGEKKKALRFFKKAYKIAVKYDFDNIEEALQSIVSALKELGKEKKGIKQVEEIYNLHKGWYGSDEGSLNNPEYRKLRLYNLAVINHNIGDYERFKHYMNQMKETLNCGQCTYCSCYEYLVLEAMQLELEKDYAEALKKYETALDIAPDNLNYMYKIKELKEKAEER